MTMPDSLTKTILENIGSLGYQVVNERGRLIAIANDSGERFVVQYDDGDRYRAACELAKLVGVDF